MPVGRARPHPEVVFETLDGEAVLLNLETGIYFTLNDTGTRIWELLGEHDGDLEEVRRTMLEEYEVEPEALDADLEELIAELEARRLVNVERFATRKS